MLKPSDSRRFSLLCLCSVKPPAMLRDCVRRQAPGLLLFFCGQDACCLDVAGEIVQQKQPRSLSSTEGRG